ncbi:MAG: hypothetical protein HY735_37255 [Verrucomicrobia bacterium]|nr:hypothetical protein [Verrucomicrobiota bacterium]
MNFLRALSNPGETDANSNHRRTRSDRRGAGQNTRGRMCSPIPTAYSPLGRVAAFTILIIGLCIEPIYSSEQTIAPKPVASVETGGLATLEISSSATPPEWALWQRHLLKELYPAALEFVRKYTRRDGTLIWRKEWPGMDGSDDGYESFYNFALYYALGGPDEMNELSHKLWDAVTRQFTRYGQIYHEFDAYYDWMHHGESYVYFYFFGLADPANRKDQQRAKRFAGLYMGEDRDAPNYDSGLKLIRSPITGSRGPRFVNSAEDWVTHREVLADYPLPYDDIPNVTESKAWIDDAKFPFILQTMNERMMRGDVPLNLTASSMVLHAFMYDGDPKYERWIEGYVSAWMERVRQNNGILPDNVGLGGKIGEHMNGKWWGGYYGWRWPHGLFNQIESTLIGAANAYLATGIPKFLELPRSVIKLVQSKGRMENGQFRVPNRYDDRGWYDLRPVRPEYLIHLWCISQDPQDYDRIGQMANVSTWDKLQYRKGKGDFGHEGPWLRFLEAKFPNYPEEILKATYGETLRRLQVIRADNSTPEKRNVHHWQERNPVVLESLVQTMLGGPNHIYHGGLLHTRLRYFDPVRKRPGIPPDVAALVDQIKPDGCSVVLVNLHPSEARSVIVQAGAFGEHQFVNVRSPGRSVEVNRRFFEVQLRPGAVGRLELTMNRYVNPPSYALPWRE